eukprot:14532268-Heterocapsa_arctica.AAC.1
MDHTHEDQAAGSVPVGAPDPPGQGLGHIGSDESSTSVKWGDRGGRWLAQISAWSSARLQNMGWIGCIKGVAAGLAHYLEVEAKGSVPQEPSMMQLPHAHSMTFGKCTRCGQDRIVRKLSHRMNSHTICTNCMFYDEAGYWPAGQCLDECCSRLRTLGSAATITDILAHNPCFKSSPD